MGTSGSSPWPPETIKHAAVDRLPFTSLPAAVAWQLERANRSRPWPGRSLDGAELYESLRSHPGERIPGSIYVESNALFEWLTRERVMDAVEREWPRADDPQCEKSLRTTDVRWDERHLDEDWKLIEAKVGEIDTEENLRSFLLHMLERCPWLAEEWPGVAAQPNRESLERVAPADLPILSEKAAAVYEILLELPPYRGMTGPALVDTLSIRGIDTDQQTLTTRIIPQLKPYGIENAPRVGYRIPTSRRPRR